MERRGTKKKRDVSAVVLKIVTYTFSILFTVMCIYPFYYVIIYSMSDPTMAAKGVYLLPRGFDVTVYKKLFERNDMMNAAFISVARTAGAVYGACRPCV